MRVVRLVALMNGVGKESGKPWYRALLKNRTANGEIVTKDVFLDAEVGEAALKAGLVEDVDVVVSTGMDEYLRPCITGIKKAEKVVGA